MRLFILGNDVEELPELRGRFTQIVVSWPSSDKIVEWATSSEVPTTLVAKDASALDDKLLDNIEEIVETDDPESTIVDWAEETDLVFMSWSDDRYEQLKSLCENDVPVLDMNDNFQELVLDDENEPELDDFDDLVRAISTRVITEVLKVVRAEMAELAKPRRHRPPGKTV